MNTDNRSKRMRRIVLVCGLLAFLGTPVVALILNLVAPNQLENGVIVTAVIGALCAGFAAWPRRGESGSLGERQGRLYVNLMIAAMIIGVIGGIMSLWLYEYFAK
jgi:uncharacterized membrane protein YjjB (DUF3815 family)